MSTFDFTFKNKHPLLERKNTSEKIMRKYPNHIPVIVERHPSSSLEHISHRKWLVPNEKSFAEFSYQVRNKIGSLNPTEALFFFASDKMVPNGQTMEQTYQKCKSEDGFLYVWYKEESTFG
jgi:GABA(A) receptor-associated protein